MRGGYKQMKRGISIRRAGVSCHVGRLWVQLIYFSSFLNQKFDILSHSIKCRRAAAHFRLIVNSVIRLGGEMFIYLLFKLYLATFWFPSRFALFLLFTFSSISFDAFLCELLTKYVCVCVCSKCVNVSVEVIWKVLFCIAANSNLVSCARPIPVDCFLLRICHSSMDVSCCCRRWHYSSSSAFMESPAAAIRFFSFIFDSKMWLLFLSPRRYACEPKNFSHFMWIFFLSKRILFETKPRCRRRRRSRGRKIAKSTLVTRGQIYIMCAMSWCWCRCCWLAASSVSDIESFVSNSDGDYILWLLMQKSHENIITWGMRWQLPTLHISKV